MNFFALFAFWLKGALKVRPDQLKGAPGIHDHEAAAAVINAIMGSTIDAQAAAHGADPSAAQSNPLSLLIAPQSPVAGLIPQQPVSPPEAVTPPGG